MQIVCAYITITATAVARSEAEGKYVRSLSISPAEWMSATRIVTDVKLGDYGLEINASGVVAVESSAPSGTPKVNR
jgi:hypothetical protein